MNSAFSHFAQKLHNYLTSSAGKSPSALQQNLQRTKLVDVQRRIGIYLRALWDFDFAIQPRAGDVDDRTGQTPFIKDGCIHLPNVYRDIPLDGGDTVPGLDIYRAAAAHASAHIVYSKQRLPAKNFDELQEALIGTIEDARVEALAIRRFPGLKKLWSTQHSASPGQSRTSGDYLARLARALLDEDYVDEDPWIGQGRELFATVGDLQDEEIARDIGLALAQELQKKKIRLNILTSTHSAAYRDDNRFLWELPQPDAGKEPLAPSTFFESKYFSIWEFARFGSGGKKKSPITFYDSKFLFAEESRPGIEEHDEIAADPESDEAARKISKLVSDKPQIRHAATETYSYPEWNFRSQIETESWVTVREMKPQTGDLQVVDHIIEQNNDLLSRMKTLLNAIRYGGVHRIRKLEEGDDIDINAAIRAQIDIRSGLQPDARIMMRSMRKTRDISVLLLLDLSKSTNEKVQGQEHTVLELTRQVCVLFADAIKTVGDPFAIHGFCSESRHNVEYYRLKDFDQPYDDLPKARLAGMTGQRATRMGAAIRHATHHLNRQQSRKKLLILITDGAPDDIDVRGTEYLLSDTKKAVEGAGRNGINTFCMSLDPRADEYVSRIFGARNYMVVDHVRSLPEKMLLLYAALTR
ncbi:nitric oxide reductase activation protein NorD [Sideroxydans lithotrophicus]|nr:VWA domain-containing protein [Sideroxydans lithotrophicus]